MPKMKPARDSLSYGYRLRGRISAGFHTFLRSARYSVRGFIRLLMSVIMLVLCVVLLGLWAGGYMPKIQATTTTQLAQKLISAGFVVKHIDIIGMQAVPRRKIIKQLGIKVGDGIWTINLVAAQQRVKEIKRIEHVVVRRLWPDHIVVEIVERQPYALWQDQTRIKLVDRAGVVLADAKEGTGYDLPFIIGENAITHLPELQAVLAVFPFISERLEAMVYVENYRWDLRLDNGRLYIALPADGILQALSWLEELNAQHSILDRPIRRLDMRIPDRLSLLPELARGT